ncbi:MAG: 3-oxoacyl-[acyl-carrier-protein] synthase 2 [Oligoflexia bacterium]|nr:MAG: 3-oxoacyl-[acyl-carrier-protein] synthase 2 [Oligoflexia bacterium]
MTKHEIVISGYSIASPLGSTITSFEHNLFSGKSGTQTSPTVPLPPRSVGLFDRSGLKYNDDVYSISAHLLNEFILQHPLPQKIDGLITSSYFTTNEANILTSFEDPDYFSPDRFEEFISSELIKRNCRPPDPTQFIPIFATCSTSHVAIGAARERILSGIWNNALVICIEPRMSTADCYPFFALGAHTKRAVSGDQASCPFSADRDGFCKSQGAGILFLERKSDAIKNGRPPLATICAVSHATDAWRHTDGRPDCKASIQVMKTALAEAHLSISEIDCISAHGTSTKLNDPIETRAIKSVFGNKAHEIPITALKSQLGHSLISAGVSQAIAACLMIKRQIIPATINFKAPDPICDLDYVPNVSRNANINNIMCNSFGFGGQNACLILSKGDQYDKE